MHEKGPRKTWPIASFMPCKRACDRCWSRGSSPNVGLYVREAETISFETIGTWNEPEK